MKALSQSARNDGRVLTKLSCLFEDVENPARENVRFKPVFETSSGQVPWGWTYEANAANPAAEAPARNAGFEVASEEYFEISGLTWVRCKVWHRP